MKKCFLFLIFIWIFIWSLQAVQIPSHHIYPPHKELLAPWFTGPLLAPSAQTIPKGHVGIEPYVYIGAITGRYDNNWHAKKIEALWINSLQISILGGVNDWIDLAFYPTLFYNHTHGASKWVVGDFPIAIDFQLYKHGTNLTDWGTALLLRIQETFPIGKYRNLNPHKKFTDVGGEGSWQTAFVLVWGNLFHLSDIYFMTWRTAFQYILPAPTHVKNLNIFGGGPGTNGTAYPAQSFQLDTAIEITLSQNWAFAMDIVGLWAKKVRFQGKTFLKNTLPASVQFSLAPAIEYNWNANLGLIAGCWFSIAGKNSIRFVDAVIAINYFK